MPVSLIHLRDLTRDVGMEIVVYTGQHFIGWCLYLE